MLIITAVFPGERLGISDCAIAEKRWTNEMLGVPVYSGVLKHCEERQQERDVLVG